MSTGAYAADKAAAHPDRLKLLREGKHPYPMHLHLVVSDLCSLDCPACAYRLSGYSSNQLFSGPNGERNPNRMLELPLVKSVLADCVAMGTRAVEITGGGEATLHPDIREILGYAQALGLDTALVTHGLLLARRNLFELAAQTAWTRISIDAATESVYGAVRPSLGGPHGENLRVALRNLEVLRNTRDLHNTACVIGTGFVVQKENWQQIYEAAKLYRNWGADNIRISGAFTPSGDAYHEAYYDKARELEQRAIADFDGKKGFRVYGRFAEKVDDLHGPPDYSTCSYQRFTTYLGGDGNLYRCCVTSYNRHGLLGNVREAGGLKALWDQNLTREKLAHFDARSCQRCQFNDRNRAINGMLRADAPPDAPSGVIHPNFV